MNQLTKIGMVYTFYSFKGGVGRTMALANVAALLAKWGHSVLVVDWDLEAPGIGRFFVKENAGELWTSKPGIVDLIVAKGKSEEIDWHECVHKISLNGNLKPVSLITAGRDDAKYSQNLQGLNFSDLFERSDLGAYIESLRKEWISEYDFVLVDSRTGVTDIGGICTVLLADVLVLFFTTTDTSTKGVLDVVNRARMAQEKLPVDRGRLFAIPVPARDESGTEVELSKKWKDTFATKFSDLYDDWLPKDVTAQGALELLRIPYIPYWSFGERLPVMEESTGDPRNISYYYDILARLVASKLDWEEALKGRTLADPPKGEVRQIDKDWLHRNREDALSRFGRTSLPAHVEIYHFCTNWSLNLDPEDLYKAAEESDLGSMVNRTGQVEKGTENRPRAMSDGIIAIKQINGFYYWRLNTHGDFYSLVPMFVLPEEPSESARVIFASHQIYSITEELKHCVTLYRNMGTPTDTIVHFAIEWTGLDRLKLSLMRDVEMGFTDFDRDTYEHSQAKAIEFTLGTFENTVPSLVMQLCHPLFQLFDFLKFSDQTYKKLVSRRIQNN